MNSRSERLGISVALGTSPRGAGFGNEVIAWGKSYIAARELGLTLMRPAWALNRYHLHKSLGWPRASLWPSEVAARLPSRIRVTENLYRSTGEIDYGVAVKKILAKRDDRPGSSLIMTHEGMWGGYASIRSARQFLRQQVLGSPRVVRALDQVSALEQQSPVIGMHIRRGDFDARAPGPGEFNRVVPIGWYVALIDQLDDLLDRQVRFLVCSDAKAVDLGPLLLHPRVELVRGEGPSAALQDLAVLVESDALVCSVSSFSMLAAFLSARPYIWYRPQLSPIGSGLTLWGQEPEQQKRDSPTSTQLRAESSGPGRGIAWESGPLPDWFRQHLVLAAALRQAGRDLLYYGNIPG